MMKKIIAYILCLFSFTVTAQWQQASVSGKPSATNLYRLDIGLLKSKISHVSQFGKNGDGAEVSVPNITGKMERFSVYSLPVVDPALAEQYDLESYVGVGIDDPSKKIRFSVAPGHFSSMTIKDGQLELIDPENLGGSLYTVTAKTSKANGKSFLCGTKESPLSQLQIERLYATAKNSTAKSSDKKYRTLRLALSVTGEYTQLFGGVTGALTQINATLTRVNGILENDLALHLNLINAPQIIFTDPVTDPYDNADIGTGNSSSNNYVMTWSKQLMNILHNSVGDANYDIGHLFGASGGGGNAACIGCICSNDMSTDSDGIPTNYKGAAFTSPADGKPYGDNFDIDYVIHEMGHQLGASHTFSYNLENSGFQMEPGSGSTIMGYAGISGYDVQPHSDPYFHAISIQQIQNNLAGKTCDVEVGITNNNPPSIVVSPSYTIPKGTAFKLTASATDPENDALTYTWEEMDNATAVITTTTGNNLTGALFRSVLPSSSPTRYFPRLSEVLSGNLTSTAYWESVPYIARTMNFRVTVRDNHTTNAQTSTGDVMITSGADGPFKITNIDSQTILYGAIPYALTWDIANTNLSPYNTQNLSIQYTADNGASWKTLSATTPNDGREDIMLPFSATGQEIQIKLEAIDNIFYAVSAPIKVQGYTGCTSVAPANVKITTDSINKTAKVTWDAVAGAGYILQYRQSTDASFSEVKLDDSSYVLADLKPNILYDVQVATVCPTSASPFSSLQTFSILAEESYCNSQALSSQSVYISSVNVDHHSNDSGAAPYTNFSSDVAKNISINTKLPLHSIRVSPEWRGTQTPVSIVVWVDFNRDNIFSDNEKILSAENVGNIPIYSNFIVPTYSKGYTRMRVSLKSGAILPTSCETFASGEVEDYLVAFSDSANSSVSSATIYPNPASEILYTTNIPDGSVYQLYDMSGRVVREGKVYINEIYVNTLASGVYVLKIDIKNGKPAIFRMIKK